MTRFFVGIGAQRAGALWLRDQLAAHPEVALPKPAEVHFFDSAFPLREGESYGVRHVRAVRQHVGAGRDERAKAALELLDLVFRGPGAYRQHLSNAAGPGTRAVGEVTPGYSMLTEEGFLAMRETLDAPRVFYVLRDPIDRYWSALRGHDAERAERRFARRRPVDTGNLARGDYRTTVPILDRVFGDDVLHLFYEDLATEETLRRLARHLGVADQWAWDLDASVDPPTAEPAGADPEAATMPEPPPGLLAQFEGQYDFVHERFGDAVPTSWRQVGHGR